MAGTEPPVSIPVAGCSRLREGRRMQKRYWDS
jgi:hypothetical protein